MSNTINSGINIPDIIAEATGQDPAAGDAGASVGQGISGGLGAVDPRLAGAQAFQAQKDAGQEAEAEAAIDEQFRHKEFMDILNKTTPA
jgi:hypothetical protein